MRSRKRVSKKDERKSTPDVTLAFPAHIVEEVRTWLVSLKDNQRLFKLAGPDWEFERERLVVAAITNVLDVAVAEAKRAFDRE